MIAPRAERQRRLDEQQAREQELIRKCHRIANLARTEAQAAEQAQRALLDEDDSKRAAKLHRAYRKALETLHARRQELLAAREEVAALNPAAQANAQEFLRYAPRSA